MKANTEGSPQDANHSLLHVQRIPNNLETRIWYLVLGTCSDLTLDCGFVLHRMAEILLLQLTWCKVGDVI